MIPPNPTFRDRIIEWNNQYPLDYYWRKKNDIKFGSKEHKETSFLEMRIDLNEDMIYKNERTKYLLREKYKSRLLIPRAARVAPISQEEIEDLFDNIDLDQFNTQDV